MNFNLIRSYLKTPYFWGTWVFLSLSLQIIGWAQSYPIGASSIETPINDFIAPWFWIGLGLCLAGLCGLVLTSNSNLVHWAASCLFLILYSSPQFLYLSWGSDADLLSHFVAFTKEPGFSIYTASETYFQWPASIFFHQFISDILDVNTYAAVLIGFLISIISIVSGLYALWYSQKRANYIFWGIVAYFVGFYWFFNWQAVPYVFFLTFLFPMLALIDKHSPKYKVIFFLMGIVALEAHALAGVWLALVAITIYLLSIKSLNKPLKISLIGLILVTQATLLIYKNSRFFKYVVGSLQGLYDQLLVTGASDKSLLIWTRNALSNVPTTQFDRTIKFFSWVDLGIFVGIFLIASIFVLLKRRLGVREIAFILVAIVYFIGGTQFAAIGTRSLQLLALGVSYFVVDSMSAATRMNKMLTVLLILGVLLLPAPLLRSQQSSNFVRPTDLLFSDYLDRVSKPELQGETLITEYTRPLSTDSPFSLMTTRHIINQYTFSCAGPAFLVDTPRIRVDIAALSGSSNPDFGSYSKVYASSSIELLYLYDCNSLNLFNN